MLVRPFSFFAGFFDIVQFFAAGKGDDFLIGVDILFFFEFLL